MLEKTLESLLDCKIKPVNPKGNQSWKFIGRTDAEAKALILWLPDENSQLTVKDPDDGKDWGQEEKWAAEVEMVGWHHQLNGHEFEQTLGDSKAQGSLVCYSQWGCKGLDITWWLKNNVTFFLFSSPFPVDKIHLHAICLEIMCYLTPGGNR